MFYVRIDHLNDQQLEFCGYVMVFRTPDFTLYRDYHGEEYIVSNDPPRYIKVDDVNDAHCLQANVAIELL